MKFYIMINRVIKLQNNNVSYDVTIIVIATFKIKTLIS